MYCAYNLYMDPVMGPYAVGGLVKLSQLETHYCPYICLYGILTPHGQAVRFLGLDGTLKLRCAAGASSEKAMELLGEDSAALGSGRVEVWLRGGRPRHEDCTRTGWQAMQVSVSHLRRSNGAMN